MAKPKNIEQGRPIGSLTAEEKRLVIAQIENTIKTYKTAFVIACISIIFLVGLLIAPAIHVAIRRQEAKLKIAQDTDLQVFEAKGVLGRKVIAAKGGFQAFIYTIDGYVFPGNMLSQFDPSDIQDHLKETVAFQYIPALSMNRAYVDASGHGYNFITKTTI